jgi:hypothetical protein
MSWRARAILLVKDVSVDEMHGGICMNIHNQSILSFYEPLSKIGNKESVTLVKHVETGQLYVKKELSFYDKSVYEVIRKAGVPNVPRIYQCLEDEGKLYVVEEYINGMNLEQYVDTYGSMNWSMACCIVENICKILEYFHDMNPPIIHRDIKPSNIILVGRLAEGIVEKVYLIDFNTARQFDKDASRDTSLIGTRGFAAPEQYGFSQSDARTDIYALGVLLNYLLCGQLVSEKIADKDMYTKYIIERATQLAPDMRYQCVGELEKDLHNILNGKSPEQFDRKMRERDRAHLRKLKRPGWCKYLPPGFRNLNIVHMVVALVYYTFWAYVSLTTKLENTDVAHYYFALWVDRIGFVLMFWGIPFICCNYLGLWKKMPLLKADSTLKKIIGCIVYSIAWLIMILMYMLILQMIA